MNHLTKEKEIIIIKSRQSEHRCSKCNRLLFKADITHAEIEVKCYACGQFNEFNIDIRTDEKKLLQFLQSLT